MMCKVKLQLNPSRLTWLRRRPLILLMGGLQTFRKHERIAMHYLARMAEMEFRKAQGELVEICVV